MCPCPSSALIFFTTCWSTMLVPAFWMLPPWSWSPLFPLWKNLVNIQICMLCCCQQERPWYPHLLLEIHQGSCRNTCSADRSIKGKGFNSLLDTKHETSFLHRQVSPLSCSNPDPSPRISYLRFPDWVCSSARCHFPPRSLRVCFVHWPQTTNRFRMSLPWSTMQQCRLLFNAEFNCDICHLPAENIVEDALSHPLLDPPPEDVLSTLSPAPPPPVPGISYK